MESDKELTMTSKEMSEAEVMDKNMEEKLFLSRFLDSSKSKDQSVSLSDLQNEIDTELKETQASTAEKIIPPSEKWKVLTKNDLKKAEQSRLEEKDLLSELIDRPPPRRPQYERENTIFLTEFRNTLSPDTLSVFILPEFLQNFKNSRWFSALGLVSEQEPEGWMEFNASSNPTYFIHWMLWTNIMPKICSQASPPCLRDEDLYLCQTVSELCSDIAELHADFQLSEECTYRLHICLIECIKNELGKNEEFKAWKMLESVSKLLVTLGFHDIDTVAILLLLYAKVLLTSESDDVQHPCEIKDTNSIQYVHKSLHSMGFRNKYHNYLEEELIQLKNIGIPTKVAASKRIFHIRDCIHLVKNIETYGYWINSYKVIFVWLESWLEPEDDKLLKDKSSGNIRQTKGILLSTIKNKSMKKEVKWVQKDDDNHVLSVLKDGIKALNTFIDWCHEQRLSELREQAKGEAIQSATLKQKTNDIKKQEIQVVHDSKNCQKHKMVMLLPPLNESDRCIVRLGESYVTERRKYRRMNNILQPWMNITEQSRYGDDMMTSQSLRDPTQPSYAQPWKSYKNALTAIFHRKYI
ncbi:unnamed protein product [Heterobilharzia americana]|nr:unnamed protein product [Heterobilharzia americana]